MKKILVPVDFGESSGNSLDYALFLAETFESEVVVLNVMKTYHQVLSNDHHQQAVEESLRSRENEYRQRLDAVAASGRSRGIPVTCDIIRNTSVPAGITGYIKQGGFDLVVMGNQSRSDPGHLILGDVSEKILRLSPVPVITIHKDWKKRAVKKILVPVDFSKGSKSVIDHIRELAEGFNAALQILFVIEEDDYPDMFSIYYHFEKEDNQPLMNEILETLSDFTGIRAGNAEFIIKVGRPYAEILDFATEEAVDFIGIPKTGQYLHEKILLGSTSDKILRFSPCPVLTVPFSEKNTTKTEYHIKFLEFLAEYKLGHGTTGMEP